MENCTRIPMDPDYTAMLGKAVYAFAYYEWTIVNIINFLEKGYVVEYCRGLPQTSGNVRNKLCKILKSSAATNTDATMQECCKDFSRLIDERNALVHAHPCTSPVDGKQVLNYQTQVDRPLSDKLWSIEKIREFLDQVDCAAAKAASILDSLRRLPLQRAGKRR